MTSHGNRIVELCSFCNLITFKDLTVTLIDDLDGYGKQRALMSTCTACKVVEHVTDVDVE